MDKLLNNEEYLKDKYKFWFVGQNRKLDTAKVFSDDETYAVVQGNSSTPVWAWTLEDLSLEKLQKVREALYLLLEGDKLEVTSRKELYKYLLESKYEYLDVDSYFELGFLECKQTLKPNECDGYMDRIKTSELELLSEYLYLDRLELPLSNMTKEEARVMAERLLNYEYFYVWRNKDGKLVSYLSYSLFDEVAKLSNVYTLKEERRKGYCANLVYTVTKQLLDEGYKPMLYTDYSYPNSNGAYKKVGYEDKGFLVQYVLRKNK